MADKNDDKKLIAQANPQVGPPLTVVPDQPKNPNNVVPLKPHPPATQPPPNRIPPAIAAPVAGGLSLNHIFWVTLFLYGASIAIDTPAAGSLAADERARREADKRRRSGQNKQPGTSGQPTLEKPQSPPQNTTITDIPPSSPYIPVQQAGTTPTESNTTNLQPDNNSEIQRIQKQQEEQRRKDQEAEEERNRKTDAEVAEINRKAEEEKRATRRNNAASNQNSDKDRQAGLTLSEREWAVYQKFNQLRADSLSSPANQDNLNKIIKLWDKRSDELRGIYKQRNLAFEKWQSENQPSTGVFITRSSGAENSDHKWLNTVGKRYQKRAEDLLKKWFEQDKQANR